MKTVDPPNLTWFWAIFTEIQSFGTVFWWRKVRNETRHPRELHCVSLVWVRVLIVFGPRLLLQINELYLETNACGYSDPSFIPHAVATSYWIAKDGLYLDILKRNTVKFLRVSDFVPDNTSSQYSLKALYLSKCGSESSQIRGIICFHYALSIDVKIENGESCTVSRAS